MSLQGRGGDSNLIPRIVPLQRKRGDAKTKQICCKGPGVCGSPAEYFQGSLQFPNSESLIAFKPEVELQALRPWTFTLHLSVASLPLQGHSPGDHVSAFHLPSPIIENAGTLT